MRVKDNKLEETVSVFEASCIEKKCYWPRVNPGSFSTGRGYRPYGDARDKEWVCGTRHAHGCPIEECEE